MIYWNSYAVAKGDGDDRSRRLTSARDRLQRGVLGCCNTFWVLRHQFWVVAMHFGCCGISPLTAAPCRSADPRPPPAPSTKPIGASSGIGSSTSGAPTTRPRCVLWASLGGRGRGRRGGRREGEEEGGRGGRRKGGKGGRREERGGGRKRRA